MFMTVIWHDKVLFLCPRLEKCYSRRKFAEHFADFTGADMIYIGDPVTRAFDFDNISAEDVELFNVSDVEVRESFS